MRNVARIVPSTAAMFLMVMAVLINSPALFYMATAMICTIGACRLQAWLSVRALRIERIAPPAVNVGELVTVSMIVWSEKRLKRPLVTVQDVLPERLVATARTPSLPVAPSFDQPIHTKYSFRPLRRGRYRWSVVNVIGTDALGLVSMEKTYRTEPAELTVYAAAIPVSVPFPPVGGGGTTEAESGRFRGSGIEPRGIREYQPGDPQRYVHWSSSARAGQLMVKEFEAGAGLCAMMFIQRTRGTDIGDGGHTTLEAMCGHAKYLSQQFMRQGASVHFPSLEPAHRAHTHYELRRQEIDEVLADVWADEHASLGDEILEAAQSMPLGGTIYVMVAVADPDLPGVLARLAGYPKVCLVYDPADYPTKKPANVVSAASSSYLHELREAGARVMVMPKVGGLE